MFPLGMGHSHPQLKWVRESLAGDRSYYVRTDGNDANTGLANTSGGAFLTIQHAINIVAGLDITIYSVTIHVADGTYAEGMILCKDTVGSGGIWITGESKTGTIIDGAFFKHTPGTIYTLTSMKLIKTTSTYPRAIVSTFGALILINDLDFSTGFDVQLSVANGGFIEIQSSITISGGAIYAWMEDTGGLITAIGGITVTVVGTPAFTVFTVAQNSSKLYAASITFSGGATGYRYVSDGNSVISTNAGGEDYFPGDQAGFKTNGGQYL